MFCFISGFYVQLLKKLKPKKESRKRSCCLTFEHQCIYCSSYPELYLDYIGETDSTAKIRIQEHICLLNNDDTELKSVLCAIQSDHKPDLSIFKILLSSFYNYITYALSLKIFTEKVCIATFPY